MKIGKGEIGNKCQGAVKDLGDLLNLIVNVFQNRFLYSMKIEKGIVQ